MRLLAGLRWRWQYLKRCFTRSPEVEARHRVDLQLDQMTDVQLAEVERYARRLLIEQIREDVTALILGRTQQDQSR